MPAVKRVRVVWRGGPVSAGEPFRKVCVSAPGECCVTSILVSRCVESVEGSRERCRRAQKGSCKGRKGAGNGALECYQAPSPGSRDIHIPENCADFIMIADLRSKRGPSPTMPLWCAGTCSGEKTKTRILLLRARLALR